MLSKRVSPAEELYYDKLFVECYGLRKRTTKHEGARHIFFIINFFKNKNDSTSLTRKKLHKYSSYSKTFTNKILKDLKILHLIDIEKEYKNKKEIICIKTKGSNIFANNRDVENTIEVTTDDIKKYGRKLLSVIKSDYLKIQLNGKKAYLNLDAIKNKLNLSKKDIKNLEEIVDLKVKRDEVFNIPKYVRDELFKNEDRNIRNHKLLHIKAPNLYWFGDNKLRFKWFNVNRDSLDKQLGKLISKKLPPNFTENIGCVEKVRKTEGVNASAFRKIQQSLYITNILDVKRLYSRTQDFMIQYYHSHIKHYKQTVIERVQENGFYRKDIPFFFYA